MDNNNLDELRKNIMVVLNYPPVKQKVRMAIAACDLKHSSQSKTMDELTAQLQEVILD